MPGFAVVSLATFSGRKPSQNEQELSRFADFMLEVGCSSYLEIGARHGDTLHYLAHRLGMQTCLVGVDLPGALWGKHTSYSALMNVKRDLRFKGFNPQIIIGDSHDQDVIEDVRIFSPFDFVLIDADHSYRAVKQDFQDYAPMARYVAFHDIVGHTQKTNHVSGVHMVEVPKLWAEIKDKYESYEFVADGSAMGIGVIKVD